MAGRRDKSKIGGIGGVNLSCLYGGQTRFGTETVYQRDAAVKRGILPIIYFIL